MDTKPTRKAPSILKKKSLLKRECPSIKTIIQCMKEPQTLNIKHDVIHMAQRDDFMKGEYPDLIIVNTINLVDNSSRIIATYVSETLGNIERTSDDVTKLIGQKNFDILITALCTVTSKELRLRSILALLTVQRATKSSSCQTSLDNSDGVSSYQKNLINTSSQTDETCSGLIQRLQMKKRKLVRSQLTPYVVKDLKPPDTVKKVVIQPHNFELTKKLIKSEEPCSKKQCDIGNQTQSLEVTVKAEKIFVDTNKISVDHSLRLKENNENNDTLPQSINVKSERESSNQSLFPELKLIVDEDSNISDVSCGNISIRSCSIPNLLENPKILLNNIEKYTSEPFSVETTTLTMLDGSQVKIQGIPKDHFHIAVPEILNHLNSNEKSKVIWYQAYIDWKFCLNRDEDYNLPIHHAVLNNDVDLLRRQCVVLKNRQETVDITAQENLTALQMALFQDFPSCTTVLLQHGANPLLSDNEQKTSIHLAAEASTDHLKVLMTYCQTNARQILHENELWRPELETKSNEEISKYLMSKICRLYDSQGYTPLMIASKSGYHNNVKILLEMDPTTINLAMPNSGNTALYLVVASACLDLGNRLDRSKVSDDYLKTVEILMNHGADPFIDNNFGSNVNLLLSEYNIPELAMLIANTFVSVKFPGHENLKKDLNAFIWVKDKDGSLKMLEMKKNSTLNESPSATTDAKPKSETLESKKRTPEIKVYSNQIIKKAEIPQTVVDSKKIKIPQYVKLTPKTCIVDVKALSKSKQELNMKQNRPENVIKITPKIVKVPKIILSNAVTISKIKPTVINISNVQSQARISKRSSQNQEKDLPIKKAKDK